MIEIRNLVKEYSRIAPDGRKIVKRAVDGITLKISPGEIFGLLGPNGAGKTTTVKMLTTLLKPTSGEIFFAGKPLDGHEMEIKRLIGVVPQNLNFDQDLTAGENLELHARLYRLPRERRERRIKELLDFVELAEIVNENVRHLSGGMKRRLLIARGLLHEPAVLFLDEPTVALDPQVRRRIWELIRKMAQGGTTILLTTHYIEEAAALCDRVAIMQKGRLLDIDTPQGFIDKFGQFVVEYREAGKILNRFFPTEAEAISFAAELPVKSEIRNSTLEDVFVELTGHSITEN